MTQISSYYSSIGFRIDNASIKRVDQQMKMMEQKLRKQSLRFKKLMNEAFNQKNMPAIKFKAFSFDTLQLQKSAQIALNKTSRLVRMQISNFEIDQAALNRKMQTSIQRAANQAKVSTKFITGNSGGYGVFNANKPALSTRFAANSYPSIPKQNAFGYGAVSGISAGSMLLGGPTLLGTGAAYASLAGTRALYAGNQDAVSARHLITNVAADPRLSKEENVSRGKQSFKYLYDESNRLGLNAKENADTYAKLLAGAMAAGNSLPTSQKMFSQVSEHATVMHLNNENTKRLSVAIAQIFSKGQVMAEELKGQIGDASPTFPSFVAKAWAERTKSGLSGGKAMGALMEAMKDGQVKSDVMLRALELASTSARPGLVLSTQTSQAEANRIANTRSLTMQQASIEGVEDGFYRVNKAIGVFAKDLAPYAQAMSVSFAQSLGAFADFSLGIRGIAQGEAGAKHVTLKAAQELPYGYLSQLNPVTAATYWSFKAAKAFGAGEREDNIGNSFISPLKQSGIKEWQTSASQMKDNAISSLMNSRSTTNNNTSQVTISPGAFVINSQATDAESLARDLEPHINNMFRGHTDTIIGTALLQYGQME